jgi:hypothetical protein
VLYTYMDTLGAWFSRRVMHRQQAAGGGGVAVVPAQSKLDD